MFRFVSCVCTILLFTVVVQAVNPYTCTRCLQEKKCVPPDCSCCNDHMPLVETRNTPQMVFFTFDDAITPSVAKFYRQLFDSRRKNPNGCSIKMTLFVSHANTVYGLVREFYDKGMEIGVHSVSHGHPSAKTFKSEAKKQKENIAKMARVPISEIKGWRSPFLEPLGDEQPKALRELDYTYDATLTISKKSRYASPIPFTLDYGWPYECKIKPCPRARHSGFWEIPVVALRDYLDNFDCVYVDGCHSPPPDEESAFQFLWDNFRGYYEGNRAPFGINMHASWFFYPDRLKAMDRFITKLGTLNDVYIVSMKQVIAWLKNPTPLADIENFEQWGCYNSTFAIKKRKREQQMKQEEIERKKRLMQAQANFAQRHRQWQKQVQENNRKQRLNRHQMRNKPDVISTTQQKPRNVLRSWASRAQIAKDGSKQKTNMRINSQFSHPSISWQRALRQQVARQSYNRKHRKQPTAVKIVRPKKNDIQQIPSAGKQEKRTSKTDNKKPKPKMRTIEIDIIRKRPRQISKNVQTNFNKNRFIQNKPPSVVTSEHQRFQLRKRLQKNTPRHKNNVSDKRKFAQRQRQIFLINEQKRLREHRRLQREKLRALEKNVPLTKENSEVTLKNNPKSEHKPQTTQRKNATPLYVKKEQISKQSGSRHGQLGGQTKGQQVHGHGHLKQPPIIIPRHFQQKKVLVQHRQQNQRLSPTTKSQRIRLNNREKEIRQEVMLAEEESSTVQHLVEEQNDHRGTPIDLHTSNNERIVNGDIVQQNLFETSDLFSEKKITKATGENTGAEHQKPIKGHKTSENKKTKNQKEGFNHQQLLNNHSQKQVNSDQPELHSPLMDKEMDQTKNNNHQNPLRMDKNQFIHLDQSPTTESVSLKSTIILSGQDNVPIEDTMSSWKNQQPQPSNVNDMTTMPPIIASSNTEQISDRTVNNHFAFQDITQSPFVATTAFFTNVRELSLSGVKKQRIQDKVQGLEYNSPQTLLNSVPHLEQTASVIESHKTNVKMDGSTTLDPVSNVQTTPVTQVPAYKKRNNANVVFSVPGYESLSFDTPTVDNRASESNKKQQDTRVPSDTTTIVTSGPHFNTTPKQKAISHNVNCQQEVNCLAPSCLCRSQHPPGDLRKNDVPQFIYITVDGPVNFLSFSKLRSLFTRQRMNPNGCRIGGTLFLTHRGTSFGLARLLHRDGLEIAAGSSKSTNNKISDNFKTDLMKIENSVRRYLPDYKLQGWRNVNFKQIRYNQFEFLKNHSIYDSSLVAASDWWPYTLDIGSAENCNAGSCSMNQDIGVWEVPLKPLVARPGNFKCLYADGCSVQPSSSKGTYEFLMDNFKQHYQASRTPFGINLNQSWFHWSNYKNIAGLSKFIDNVLQRRDVFIVSIADMLHWIKHPTPTYKINHSVPWKC